MAVNRKPILKTCRELGISPMVMGVGKETKRDPNAGKRKKGFRIWNAAQGKAEAEIYLRRT